MGSQVHLEFDTTQPVMFNQYGLLEMTLTNPSGGMLRISSGRFSYEGRNPILIAEAVMDIMTPDGSFSHNGWWCTQDPRRF